MAQNDQAADAGPVSAPVPPGRRQAPAQLLVESVAAGRAGGTVTSGNESAQRLVTQVTGI